MADKKVTKPGINAGLSNNSLNITRQIVGSTTIGVNGDCRLPVHDRNAC